MPEYIISKDGSSKINSYEVWVRFDSPEKYEQVSFILNHAMEIMGSDVRFHYYHFAKSHDGEILSSKLMCYDINESDIDTHKKDIPDLVVDLMNNLRKDFQNWNEDGSFYKAS